MRAPISSALFVPTGGVGAALALPFADTEAMQLYLEEISRHVAEGAHAVLLLDRAGWHTTAKLDVPSNITSIFLPSRAPELNPVENIWQFLRGNWLSNLVSRPMTTSSTPLVTLGAISSPSHRPSPQSECVGPHRSDPDWLLIKTPGKNRPIISHSPLTVAVTPPFLVSQKRYRSADGRGHGAHGVPDVHMEGRGKGKFS